ncbi:MAG: hypothetical protein MUP85_07910, partial [Candidatus Lokiarchaeota archaeon]|nr:hypothetical protein [Candidatus Lokiarchaeota archaeon]
SLDENGWQKFVWLNRSDYYYEAYYHNDDYNPIDTLIDTGTVSRKTESINSTTINVNERNFWSGQPDYKVDEVFLVSGTNMTGPSTYEIGSQTIISANISLQNMQDNLTSVKIWYIDENGNDDGPIYLLESKTYLTETSDFLSFNLTGVKEAYGLRIEVIGQNQTRCDGTVTVSFTETQTIDISADRSSMEIYVSANEFPISEVIVQVTNSSTAALIVDLITSSGYAVDSTGNPLWYLRGDYNISLIFFGNPIAFNITNEVPTLDSKGITLNTYTTLNVAVILDPTQYRSAFSDTEGDQTVIWGENMHFQVNFTVSEDGGVSWNPLTGSATVTYYIKTLSNIILDSGTMTPPTLPDGIYSLIYNSSKLVADNDYKMTVFGNAKGYTEPIPVTFFIKVNPVPTQLSVFNYISQTNYTSNEETEYWTEAINFTVFYYREGNFDAKLTDATLSYEWNFGSGPILQDPLKLAGYYYFELDTSDASIVGKYRIDITASLENHTKIEDFGFYINILSRPTELNGSTDVIFVSESIYALEAQNFTFNYVDILTSNPISNPYRASYTWQKLDEIGDPIPG